ncbi:hypothetical protein [Paenibacillus polymyxa]|uniref:hypothetical protein n=1 Tax=Paenibacillus polymyxa TaxID=1406 RepID=UPI003D9C6FB2
MAIPITLINTPQLFGQIGLNTQGATDTQITDPVVYSATSTFYLHKNYIGTTVQPLVEFYVCAYIKYSLLLTIKNLEEE